MTTKDNRLRWGIVVLLFVAMVIAYIDRGNMSMVAPLLGEEISLTAAGKGYIFSAFLIGYACMQIPAGRLVDRYGVKNIYAIFYGLWGITAALFGIGTHFWHFIVLRLLLGVCEAVSGPASFKFIATYFTRNERGLASGIFLAGTKIGPAIGAVVAVYLIEAYGWRMLFVLSGLVPLLWLAPWLISMNRIERRKAHFDVGNMDMGVATVAVPLTRILKIRKAWGIFLGYFCYGYVWYLYISWLPSYLHDSVGLSISETGWWAAYVYGGLAIVTIVAGYAADTLIARGGSESKVRLSFIIAGFFCGAVIMLIPFVENEAVILAVLLTAISGMGLATANTWAITQTISPTATVGTFSGIQNFGATSGGAIAPVLTGYLITDMHSYDTVFVVAGIIMLLGIFSYVFLIGKVETLNLNAFS